MWTLAARQARATEKRFARREMEGLAMKVLK
jgi:hypothetical protein